MYQDQDVRYLAQFGADRAFLTRILSEIDASGHVSGSSIQKKKLEEVLLREEQWRKDEVIGDKILDKYRRVKEALGIKDVPENGEETADVAHEEGINSAPKPCNIVDAQVVQAPAVEVPTQVASAVDRSLEQRVDGTPQLVERVQQPTPKLAVIPLAPAAPILPLSVDAPVSERARGMPITTSPAPTFVPSLKDIDNFFESYGLVGEEDLRKLLVYARLARVHVGIESLSGAGKSKIMEPFIDLTPEDKRLVLQQASEKAIFNDPNINDYDFWFITELQKVTNATFLEILKNLTEGVSSKYTRTNNKKDGVDKFEITPGKTVCYTLAITNDYFKKKDKEFSRRFVVFYTDISAEQNERVIRSIAERGLVDRVSSQDTERFRQHVLECLDTCMEPINPFLPYFVDSLPRELLSNVRVRSFIQHYQSLIGGCTIYHHNEREKLTYTSRHCRDNGIKHSHEDDAKKGSTAEFPIAVFSTVFDNMHLAQLYGRMFYDNIVGLSVIDRLILDAFSDETSVSHDELIARLEAKGFYDKTEVIKESLGNLEDLRYVELEKTESGNKGRYTLLKSSTGMVEIDWAAALQSADKYMTRKFPTIRDKWYMTCEAQLEQCAGLVHHTQGSEGSVAILDPSHALDEVTQNGT